MPEIYIFCNILMARNSKIDLEMYYRNCGGFFWFKKVPTKSSSDELWLILTSTSPSNLTWGRTSLSKILSVMMLQGQSCDHARFADFNATVRDGRRRRDYDMLLFSVVLGGRGDCFFSRARQNSNPLMTFTCSIEENVQIVHVLCYDMGNRPDGLSGITGMADS